MADRSGLSARPAIGAGITRGRNATNSVRRNLFQSQLTRRPTPAASGSAETLVLDSDAPSESSEIVVRDQNGDVVDLGNPPTTVFDDSDDIAPGSQEENEKERQRLADAVKSHQISQNNVPALPDELLEAVRASLKAKVAALAKDNWMYEREDIPKY